jgi:hypothetical protein
MPKEGTFYSRHRERMLAYQHAYNAAHYEERRAYDKLRWAKRKEMKKMQKEEPKFSFDGPVKVSFE